LVREPLKTSLDAGDTKESNELDKKYTFKFEIYEKIHVYVFAVLIFGDF